MLFLALSDFSSEVSALVGRKIRQMPTMNGTAMTTKKRIRNTDIIR